MILIPIGTKAQLIKMAPVITALGRHEVPFDFVLTGQHQDTMDDLINGFHLPAPAYELAAIDEADTSRKLAAWLIKILKNNLKSNSAISKKNYKYCLVHGDTASTLVGALIARRHGIPVAHIEAGLRSHNLCHPFPEELTRLLVSRLANLFYSSGELAAQNIRDIKRNAEIVDIGQNTLLDSVRLATSKNFLNCDTSYNRPYCVVSIHRFENIANRHRLDFIMETIQRFSQSMNVKFVMHAATKNKLAITGWLKELQENQNLDLLPRMRYFEFINLISKSQFLVSDGGSNQEECSYLSIPCLLMRKKTERMEGIEANVVLSEYRSDIIDQFFDRYSKPNHEYVSSLNQFHEQPSEKIAIDLKRRI